MWKCKKCGEKIRGYYTGYIDIDENGYPIDGTREDEEIDRYDCDCIRIIKFGNLTELKKNSRLG